MNIIFYINTLGGGGAERVLTVLANQCALRGITTTVITSLKCDNEYELNDKVTRIILEENKESNVIVRNLSRIKKIRKICKSSNPNVLVSFLEEANYRSVIATIGLKVKSIISVRTDPAIAYRSLKSKILSKMLYSLADGCVFQTEHAKKWFSKSIQRKSRVILNPISNNFYTNIGKPISEKIIVAVGRLVPEKNFELLIRAFSLICHKFPDFTLNIYGDGTEKEKLSQLISELNASNKIILYGKCENIPEEIKNASLFVMSSNVEGLPNSLMEAMALGLPIITTDFSGGGAKNLIDNEEDGIIVPTNDLLSLSSAMEKLLSNQTYAHNLAVKVKKKAETFKVETITNQWIEYFDNVLNGLNER